MVRSVVRLLVVGALLAVAAQGQAATPGVEEGVRELAIQLANAMSGEAAVQGGGSGSIRKLAVIEFSDLNGYRSTLGPFIAEELTTQLFVAKPGVFDIVERQQLAKVLQEQKLGATGLFDAETIANIGKILGIQAIITGSIADLGEEIKINARLISVESARVFAAASVKCPKKGMVETLMRQGAANESAGGQPADRASGRQAQASDVYFQNSLVRITVQSISLSKAKVDGTLALQLENLSGTSLFLTVNSDATGIIDNKGNAIGVNRISGITWEREQWTEKGDFTRFDSKSRSTLAISFRVNGGSIGNLLTFSAEFLMLEGDKMSRFSVGIPNIELR